jgi:hypothetical protein
MKPAAVMLIGKNSAETTRATAAVYCAGARIVSSAAQLAVMIEMKSGSKVPRRLGVPLIALVPPGQKRKALRARVDGAYVRPISWNVYLRLVERLIAQWAVTRAGSRPRRGRTS